MTVIVPLPLLLPFPAPVPTIALASLPVPCPYQLSAILVPVSTPPYKLLMAPGSLTAIPQKPHTAVHSVREFGGF